MGDSRKPPFLAVDGGGTRCRIAVSANGQVTTVETGPANVTTDFEGGAAQVIEGLHVVAARAGRTLDDLLDCPAYVGLAGVAGPGVADRLRAALPLTYVRIEDDRPAAIRGALGARDGVIAHCGTGSFFGAQIGGDMRFAGGWGPVLGDEASAQWIGRMALRLALETVDGRAATTPLAAALLDRFAGVEGIVSFARTAAPAAFGALAPLVTQHAATGDALGAEAMRAGAADIARSLTQIGWTPGKAICLTGGLGPQFKTYLPPAMQADLAAPAGEPLAGALSLAAELSPEMCP